MIEFAASQPNNKTSSSTNSSNNIEDLRIENMKLDNQAKQLLEVAEKLEEENKVRLSC